MSSNQLSGTVYFLNLVSSKKSHKSWLSHEISGITHGIPGSFCKQKRLLTVFPYFISFSNPNLDGRSLLNYHQNMDHKMLANFELFCYIPMLQKKNSISSTLEIHLYLSFNEHENFCPRLVRTPVIHRVDM